MINFSKKKTDISPEVFINTIWVSSFLAMIFTLPHWDYSWEFISGLEIYYRCSNWIWSSFCHSWLFQEEFQSNNSNHELTYKEDM